MDTILAFRQNDMGIFWNTEPISPVTGLMIHGHYTQRKAVQVKITTAVFGNSYLKESADMQE